MRVAKVIAIMVALAPGAAGAQGLIDDLAGAGRAAGQASGGPAPGGAPHRSQLKVDELDPAWSGEPKRAGDQIGPGTKIWRYHPHRPEIINVRAADWTVIYFPEWEEAIRFELGDDSSFEVVRPTNSDGSVTFKNVLKVRPTENAVRADTSLHVFGRSINGKRNIYTARLRSFEVFRADEAPALAAVKGKPGSRPPAVPASQVGAQPTAADPTDMTVFVKADRPSSFNELPEGGRGVAPGPGEPLAETPAPMRAAKDAQGNFGHMGQEAKRKPDYLRELPFNMANARFEEYEVYAQDSESETIAPVRVFHDGVFTGIDFGEGGRSDRILRPIVLRVIDQIDTLVNTRTSGPDGNILVVEGVGYDLTLKNGERIVCIRYVGNTLKGLPGQGATGTRSPSPGGGAKSGGYPTLNDG